MILNLFRDEPVPAAGNGILAILRFWPPEGEAWRMGAPDSEILAEFTANATNLQLQFAVAPRDDIQLESVVVTATGTTPVSWRGRFLPYMRLYQIGTSDGTEVLRVALATAFPVERLTVEYARPGLHFQAGDDLTRTMRDRVEAW